MNYENVLPIILFQLTHILIDKKEIKKKISSDLFE